MRGGRVGWWCAVAAVGLAVGLPFVAALGWDRYSHRSQYISELGAEGAPGGVAVSVAFVVVGVLFGAWAAVAAPRAPAALGMVGAAAVAVWLAGGGLGVAYAGSGVARCQPGCPDEDVGTAQLVHTVVSTVGYSLAIVALVVFGLAARRGTARAAAWRVGLAGLVAAPMLAAMGVAIPLAGEWRGLVQRLLDLALYGWVLAVAHLVAHPAPAAAAPAAAGSEEGVSPA